MAPGTLSPLVMPLRGLISILVSFHAASGGAILLANGVVNEGFVGYALALGLVIKKLVETCGEV
jgi:hypothetical protein